MSNQDTNQRRWPKSFTTEKYGSFVAVHQDYEMWDLMWNCTYRRNEDGRYFTFGAQSGRSDWPSDFDRILQHKYASVFLPHDAITKDGSHE